MKIFKKFTSTVRKRLVAAILRGYSVLASQGKANTDWILNGLSEDADLFSNAPRLIMRSRDLWKENPFVKKFGRDMEANVFGRGGISCQMRVTETEDRVVYSEDEKKFLKAMQFRHDERIAFLKENRITIRRREFINLKAKAQIKAGAPDVYANKVIWDAWTRWQRREFCTVSKRFTYAQTRHQRLKSWARDGGVFIRIFPGYKNEFRFAIQLIPYDQCDFNLNVVGPARIGDYTVPAGREVRMGIEYSTEGEELSFFFIKRRPGDWRRGYGGAMSPAAEHYRVEARHIIHYATPEDGSAGRGVPLVVAAAQRLRHLDKYEESEVIAARAEACKGGHYEANIEGLDPAEMAEIIEKNGQKAELFDEVEPGMWKALPMGWTAKAHNPSHPNGQYAAFRKDILRTVAAALPGENYNSLGSDYEGVNYTSYKAARFDCNEVWMMIQEFDIDVAERPIFEAWLEMALMSGAIPLPFEKFDKFNQPRFQGRRWKGLEPYKEASAQKLRIDIGITSRTRITEEEGGDLEEIVEELAVEKAMFELAGLPTQGAAVDAALATEEGGEPKAGAAAKD